MNKRVIAINLPQFHPFKENDEWWGKGFTEWTNVTKSKPRYWGHYQPHLPTDTGFYDLRLPESREMQAQMAKEVGIYGFCYYHYWFNGKQLMDRPVRDILKSNSPDFPFMLCWANENWARNWDGGFNQVLISQIYSEEDDRAHMKYLCENVFCDSRYIRVDGKAVFCVYKPSYFPDMKRTIETWREVAKKYNTELYLIYCDHQGYKLGEYLNKGFDSSLEFQPFYRGDFGKYSNILARLTKKILPHIQNPFNTFYSYPRFVDYQIRRTRNNSKQYPCASPGFDNSPRRKGGFIMYKGSNPSLFKKWLNYIVHEIPPYSKEENFVFINAWNEWAEGNHLEPDIKWGRKYLDAVKEVLIKI